MNNEGSIGMVNDLRLEMVDEMRSETPPIPVWNIRELENMSLEDMEKVLDNARHLLEMPVEERLKHDSREWPDGYGIREAINTAVWNWMDIRYDMYIQMQHN